MNPMLAQTYTGQNIAGWLMSEKLDGIRAIWTGSELLSRNGNRFSAPDWFTNQLPKGTALDGELFAGRGQLQRVASTVRKKTPVDAQWRTIRFCVFDAPLSPGGFENRLAFCASILSGCKVAKVVPHRVCRDKAALDAFFSGIREAGGEGVMLRASNSRYENRRSDNLLKYKTLFQGGDVAFNNIRP